MNIRYVMRVVTLPIYLIALCLIVPTLLLVERLYDIIPERHHIILSGIEEIVAAPGMLFLMLAAALDYTAGLIPLFGISIA